MQGTQARPPTPERVAQKPCELRVTVWRVRHLLLQTVAHSHDGLNDKILKRRCCRRSPPLGLGGIRCTARSLGALCCVTRSLPPPKVQKLHIAHNLPAVVHAAPNCQGDEGMHPKRCTPSTATPRLLHLKVSHRLLHIVASLTLRRDGHLGEALNKEACAGMLPHVQTPLIRCITPVWKKGVQQHLVSHLPSGHVRLGRGCDCAHQRRHSHHLVCAALALQSRKDIRDRPLCRLSHGGSLARLCRSKGHGCDVLAVQNRRADCERHEFVIN
mmetsp:Transcript_21010/g.40798  ORF Transcript_21010/g.40798 Transcript_21010/m.40798 type:complete len:271 (-) Transcript_21010:204-1016(-)